MPVQTHGNQPQWITAPSCTKAQHSSSLKQIHLQRKVNSPLPALPPPPHHHLTTCKKLLGCQKEERTITRGGILAPPRQVKSQQERERREAGQNSSGLPPRLGGGRSWAQPPRCLSASSPLILSPLPRGLDSSEPLPLPFPSLFPALTPTRA